MITRIEISQEDEFDMEEVDELIKDYKINKKDIISITHGKGMVYLYYFIESN